MLARAIAKAMARWIRAQALRAVVMGRPRLRVMLARAMAKATARRVRALGRKVQKPRAVAKTEPPNRQGLARANSRRNRQLQAI
jgi:hypothetical protein